MKSLLRIEASVSQTPLARRSVVTITLTGGDPPQREATVQGILSWLETLAPAAEAPAPPAISPSALASVFARLSQPPPLPTPAEDVLQVSHARPMLTGYEDPFLLAPIDAQSGQMR